MRVETSIRILAVLSVLLATSASLRPEAASVPLRVVCRDGQPPFAFLEKNAAGDYVCKGVLIDAFVRSAIASNIAYTLTTEPVSSKAESSVRVDSTNTSAADVLIAFSTVTPDRLAVNDFSPVLYQVDYRAVVDLTLRRTPTSLVDVIFRRATLYVLAIMSIAIAVVTIVLFFAEIAAESEDIIDLPRHHALLLILENSLEIVLTGGCSIDLHSQISRSFRVCGTITGLFMLAIFGSVITAKLTSSVLQSRDPSFADLTGRRIASTGNVLTPYLASKGVLTDADYNDVQVAAKLFHSGLRPNITGYATTTPVAMYLLQQFGGPTATRNGALTEPFFLGSGNYENKALPISRRPSNATAIVALNVGLQQLRDASTLNELLAQYVRTDSSSGGDGDQDLPVEEGPLQGLWIASVVLYSLILLCVAALFMHRRVNGIADHRTDDGEDRDRRDGDDAPSCEHSGGVEHSPIAGDGKPAGSGPLEGTSSSSVRDGFEFAAGHETLRDALLAAGIIRVCRRRGEPYQPPKEDLVVMPA